MSPRRARKAGWGSMQPPEHLERRARRLDASAAGPTSAPPMRSLWPASALVRLCITRSAPSVQRALQDRGGERVVDDQREAVARGRRRPPPRMSTHLERGVGGALDHQHARSRVRPARRGRGSSPGGTSAAGHAEGRAAPRARAAWCRRRATALASTSSPAFTQESSAVVMAAIPEARTSGGLAPLRGRPGPPPARAGWGWRSACRGRAPRRPRGSGASRPTKRRRTSTTGRSAW